MVYKLFLPRDFPGKTMSDSKKQKKDTDSKNLGMILQDQNKILKKLIKEIEKNKAPKLKSK